MGCRRGQSVCASQANVRPGEAGALLRRCEAPPHPATSIAANEPKAK
jgi:hypothetical protein